MRDYRRPNPTGVLIIMLINVVVFIFARLRPESVFDVLHFDLQPSLFASHPWSIITNCFVHYDFYHILANMVTLYFFGTYLTMLVGEAKFLATYLIGGLAGSLAYLLWALYTPWGDPYVSAIGASGAVFAVGGALAILQPNLKVLLFFVIPMPLWVAVIGGFVLMTVLSASLSIAWEAHLGGLLVGLGAGLLFRRRPRPRDRYLL